MPNTSVVFDRSMDAFDHRLKLARSREHIKTLKALVERFVEDEPYRFVHDLDLEQRRYTVHAEILKEAPQEWGPIVGDCIHNLRSCLDSIVYSLNVVGSGGTPRCPRSSQFPIVTNIWEFFHHKGRVRKMLWDVPGQAVTEIEAHQPYNSLTTLNDHPLAILNQLSNLDKHRLLVPVVTNMIEPAWGIIYSNDIKTTGTTLRVGVGELKHGAIMAGFTFDITGPNPEMKMEFNCPVDVALPKSLCGRNYPLVKTLDWLALVVEDAILRSLEPVLLRPS